MHTAAAAHSTLGVGAVAHEKRLRYAPKSYWLSSLPAHDMSGARASARCICSPWQPTPKGCLEGTCHTTRGDARRAAQHAGDACAAERAGVAKAAAQRLLDGRERGSRASDKYKSQ
jgi:hypothetical protein